MGGDRLRIMPITLKAASAFVKAHHRHNDPVTGHKFSISVLRGDELVGVANIGRPVARALDNSKDPGRWITAEVNRTCTDGARNANSMLYGAAWRACKAMGYTRLITYTQKGECGASLRAAGFRMVKELPARKSWADSSVKLKSKKHPVGTGGVPRILWEITARNDNDD